MILFAPVTGAMSVNSRHPTDARQIRASWLVQPKPNPQPVGQLRRLSDVQKLGIGEESGQRYELLARKAQRKIANDVIRSFRKKQTDSAAAASPIARARERVR